MEDVEKVDNVEDVEDGGLGRGDRDDGAIGVGVEAGVIEGEDDTLPDVSPMIIVIDGVQAAIGMTWVSADNIITPKAARKAATIEGALLVAFRAANVAPQAGCTRRPEHAADMIAGAASVAESVPKSAFVAVFPLDGETAWWVVGIGRYHVYPRSPFGDEDFQGGDAVIYGRDRLRAHLGRLCADVDPQAVFAADDIGEMLPEGWREKLEPPLGIECAVQHRGTRLTTVKPWSWHIIRFGLPLAVAAVMFVGARSGFDLLGHFGGVGSHAVVVWVGDQIEDIRWWLARHGLADPPRRPVVVAAPVAAMPTMMPVLEAAPPVAAVVEQSEPPPPPAVKGGAWAARCLEGIWSQAAAVWNLPAVARLACDERGVVQRHIAIKDNERPAPDILVKVLDMRAGLPMAEVVTTGERLGVVGDLRQRLGAIDIPVGGVPASPGGTTAAAVPLDAAAWQFQTLVGPTLWATGLGHPSLMVTDIEVSAGGTGRERRFSWRVRGTVAGQGG